MAILVKEVAYKIVGSKERLVYRLRKTNKIIIIGQLKSVKVGEPVRLTVMNLVMITSVS